MRLVVAADDAAAGREDEDAVGGSLDMESVVRPNGDSAGQQQVSRSEARRGLRALEFGGLLPGCSTILKGIGDRRLRPQKEAWLIRWAARELSEAPGCFFVKTGPPFVFLADVRLNDADVADGQRVGWDRRGRQDPEERGDCENDDKRQPFLVIFEPDRAAEHDNETRQA